MTNEEQAPAPDPSWARYPDTILELGGAAPLQIDLREPIAPDLASRLRELGLGTAWGVVTAYNPHGRNRDAAGNAERHRKLERVVGEAGVRSLPADGRSPEADHRERGLAVALPQREAVALAARFGQSAIFWFDGESFWLVPAAAAAEPLRLPPV